ncbi:MAG: tetratricopeptide repeat protein [Trueperaceae bacterium]
MRLRTLGRLALEGVDFRRPKPLLLLAYLALEGPRDRRFLSALFWSAAAEPMTSLRVALGQLRRGAPGAIATDGAMVATSIPSDAGELLSGLGGDELADPRRLYAGPFLDAVPLRDLGVELEEWVYRTREYIAQRLRHHLLRRAELDAVEGNVRRAADIAVEALDLPGAPELDPEELERLHRVLITCDSPRAAEVRREAAELGIALEHRMDEARAMLRRVVRGQRAAPRFRLPQPPTSFVGRDAELLALAALIRRDDVRLVTITGLGGIGKSRLAASVAAEEIGRDPFGDAVGFVRLDTVTDSERIADAVADQLALRRDDGEGPLAALARELGDAPLLLVLDNVEHLVAGAGRVADLLETCPRATLLVTSRVRLGLTDEQLFPIEGLPFATDGPPADAMYSDALQLFVQRAKRVHRDFAVEPADLPHVREICRRVEGSPLAIELAAPWVRAIPVEAIAEEIGRHLDFLTASSRDVPYRQRSLRATFEHSWELLTPAERRALERLSVFVDGFDRLGATRVAGASIPLLAALVDSSLIRHLPDGRYTQHPLAHSFAREKLARESENERDARSAHAAYHRTLVEEEEHALKGAGQAQALARLDLAYLDVRATLEWFVSEGRAQRAQGTAGALWQYWSIRGRLTEGRQWYRAALELGDADAATTERGKALSGAGVLAFMQADYDEARRLHEAAADVRRQLGEDWGVAASLYNLASVHAVLGDLDTAAPIFEKCVTAFRALGNAWSVALALGNLGVLRSARGDLDAAAACYEESLELRRAAGDTLGVAETLVHLGNLSRRRGDEGAALVQLRSALALAVDAGERSALPPVLEAFASLFLASGDPLRAVRIWGAVTRERETLELPLQADKVEAHARLRADARDAVGAAAYARAWGEGESLPFDAIVHEVLDAPDRGAEAFTPRSRRPP